MDLKALLPHDHVLRHLQTTDRRGVLRQLAEPLIRDRLITDPDRFLADLERREDEITTQAEMGVAFPHARSPAVRRLALTVGIAVSPGLLFNAALGEPCRLLFLIGVPALAPTAHLPLLQHLANFARDPARIEKLVNSKTIAQCIRCLVTYRPPPDS